MNTQNFCVNCKYCEKERFLNGIVCRCTYFRDPVSGNGKDCRELRSPYGPCGQYGKNFKPRKEDE